MQAVAVAVGHTALVVQVVAAEPDFLELQTQAAVPVVTLIK
jgi:hypothetical protein